MGLLNVKGKLYGTTSRAGEDGYGTVVAITPSARIVLHNFKGIPDGEYPYVGLINVNGTLMGTTLKGAAQTVAKPSRNHDVPGKETLLHSFTGSGDGEYPIVGLIDVGATLYPTTPAGAKRRGDELRVIPTKREVQVISLADTTPSGKSNLPVNVAIGEPPAG